MIAWALGLAVLGGVFWFLVLPSPSWSGQPAWVRLVVVAAIALWTLACWRTKHWLQRGTDTPTRQRVLGVLAKTPVRVGLALLAFPLGVGWMIGFTGLLGGRSGSLLVGVISNAHMGLMFTGFAFLGLAFVRRGDEPRCRKCQYDLAGAPEEGYELCPECGSGLRSAHAIRRGTRRVIVPMVVFGVALVVVSYATIGTFLRGSSSYMPLLPTDSLIKEVTTAPRGFTMDEWAELLTRSLSPQQAEWLFEGLLDLRDDRGYYASEAEGWMDQAALSRAVPSEAIQRYYEGMLELWIAAPDMVRRSQPGDAWIGYGADHKGNLSVPSHAVLRVYFEPDSLTVDGRPADMVRDPRQPLPGLSMNTTDQSYRGEHRDRRTISTNGPQARLDPSAISGDSIEIRGTGRIMVVPYGAPASAAVWTKRIDVSKKVRVEP